LTKHAQDLDRAGQAGAISTEDRGAVISAFVPEIVSWFDRLPLSSDQWIFEREDAVRLAASLADILSRQSRRA